MLRQSAMAAAIDGLVSVAAIVSHIGGDVGTSGTRGEAARKWCGLSGATDQKRVISALKVARVW
jgi:hypothetical protein